MNGNSSIDSSRFVSAFAIIFWFAGAVASACLDYYLPAGIMMLFSIVGIAARLWAKHSADRLEIELSCSNAAVFPETGIEFSYTIKNGKLLPVIWLELSQDVPENCCIVPGEEFESYVYHMRSEDEVFARNACRRNFSFIPAMEEVSFSSEWQAASRGIYAPERLMLRSGDGFGLAILETLLPESHLPVITVYPRLVPVDISPLLKYAQGQMPGRSGFFEDVTFLRGTSPYEPSDNWKHINWRMIARGMEELQVNRFEKLQPFSALFILDGENFQPDEEGKDALERTIEIIASAAFVFFEKGFSCGVCLPRSKGKEEIVLAPGSCTDLAEILSCLAGYSPLNEREMDGNSSWTGNYTPSRFSPERLKDAALSSGAVFVFSYDGRISGSILRSVDESKLIVWAIKTTEGSRARNTLLLRKGGEEK